MKRLNTYMQAESTAAAVDKAAAVLVWKLLLEYREYFKVL